MATREGAQFLQEHPDNDSIPVLPPHLHDGLIAVSVFAGISFVTSTTLWLYLNYKLIAWHLRWRSRARFLAKNIPEPSTLPDLNFGHSRSPQQPGRRPSAMDHEQNLQQIRTAKHAPPNQFLVLIYNLFLADMLQSASFLLSVIWLRDNAITITSKACYVQGIFESTGNLASSCFITFIAIHTYLSVTKRYQPPQITLYILVMFVWLMVYGLSCLPVVATKNGRDTGGFFVRAGAWCWISEAYEDLQLYTHYIFIFLSLFITSALYLTIYFVLHRQSRRGPPNVELSHKPAFLIYPLIYVLCTLPLAAGRIAIMSGANVPLEYNCFAGAMIACNGTFDCLLFGTTRQSILFGSTQEVDAKSTGLDTYSFMRTPVGRFGNKVYIQGGKRKSGIEAWNAVGGWWQSWGSKEKAMQRPSPVHSRNASEESLRDDEPMDLAIHMDVVTSMTVEIDAYGNRRYSRVSRRPSATSQSISSRLQSYPSVKVKEEL